MPFFEHDILCNRSYDNLDPNKPYLRNCVSKKIL